MICLHFLFLEKRLWLFIRNTLCCPMLNELITTVKLSLPLQKKMAKPFIQHMKKSSNWWRCTSRFCWDLTTLTLALKSDSLMCWGMIGGKRPVPFLDHNSAFPIWSKGHLISTIRKVCGLPQYGCMVVECERSLFKYVLEMSHCLVKELSGNYRGFFKPHWEKLLCWRSNFS